MIAMPPFLFVVLFFMVTMIVVWFEIQYYHDLYYTPTDNWIYVTDANINNDKIEQFPRRRNNIKHCPRIWNEFNICRPAWMASGSVVIHPDMMHVTCKHGTWSWFRNSNSNIDMYRLVCKCNHDAVKLGTMNDDCVPAKPHIDLATLSNPPDRLTSEQSVDAFPYTNPCLFDALTGERFSSPDQCVLERTDRDGDGIWFCRPNDRHLLGVRTRRDVLKGNGGRYCNACVQLLKPSTEAADVSIYTEWYTTPHRHPIVGFRVDNVSLLRENIAEMITATGNDDTAGRSIVFHDAPLPLDIPDFNRYYRDNAWNIELNTGGAGFPGTYDQNVYFLFIPIRAARRYVRLKPVPTRIRNCDSIGRTITRYGEMTVPRPVEPDDPSIIEIISEHEKDRLLYDAFSVCLSHDYIVRPNIRLDHVNYYKSGGPTNILVSTYGKRIVSPYRPFDTDTFNGRILNKLYVPEDIK